MKAISLLTIFITILLIMKIREFIFRNYWIANYEVLPISIYSTEGIPNLYRGGCWIRVCNGTIQIKKRKTDIENQRVYKIGKIKTLYGADKIYRLFSIKFEYEKGEIVKINSMNSSLIKKWIFRERDK